MGIQRTRGAVDLFMLVLIVVVVAALALVAFNINRGLNPAEAGQRATILRVQRPVSEAELTEQQQALLDEQLAAIVQREAQLAEQIRRAEQREADAGDMFERYQRLLAELETAGSPDVSESPEPMENGIEPATTNRTVTPR